MGIKASYNNVRLPSGEMEYSGRGSVVSYNGLALTIFAFIIASFFASGFLAAFLTRNSDTMTIIIGISFTLTAVPSVTWLLRGKEYKFAVLPVVGLRGSFGEVDFDQIHSIDVTQTGTNCARLSFNYKGTNVWLTPHVSESTALALRTEILGWK